jgi:D-beta-D-heptose 7-phosphate kinase/D-beta-D-heptose 1-phosphate adenosyltransferase
MSLFERGGRVTHIPTVAREVYDVTGAGDTVISVLTLAMAAGAPMGDAARISNYAAGIVVGVVGTATVRPGELKENILSGRV